MMLLVYPSYHKDPPRSPFPASQPDATVTPILQGKEMNLSTSSNLIVSNSKSHTPSPQPQGLDPLDQALDQTQPASSFISKVLLRHTAPPPGSIPCALWTVTAQDESP